MSGLLAQGPLVLNFYRGLWCPYCNLELAALQKSLATIEGLNATLVAVSPQTPEASAATASKLGLSFKVLVDQGNQLAWEFGLVFTLSESLRPIYAAIGIDLPAANGDNSFMLPMPATYIIARDGTIAYAFVDADYTHRMEPSDMCAVLERLKSA
ncbi:peroxiredoxin-like family protein [Undibacterium crateris]|uniref:peroxiredoxin-like family protein n=1 Tax=Undibacterium crateris TaxID=2528175 RepID=UPI0013893E6E|nr:peroxiredoxin-like family protein [Undibacterium crateris]NDI86358.1 redoxin domain-containing protein [Undibacterium crateris]